jgi:parvulin-like peptidyl-prolyl isomerase
MEWRQLLSGALLALAAGCGGQGGGPLVAKAGPEGISAAQLEEYAARIPEGLKQGATPPEVRRRLLESLIDLRLLLQEARATAVEADPAFADQMAMARRGTLLDLYQRRAINEKLGLAPEEVERHYRETHRDRALRFSGIMLPTREEALEVIAELKAGADFHRLAAARSEHRETGERGGDSGGYKLRDQMSPAIAEGVAHLKVGDISAPVPVPYQGRTHFVVFKILDEMPAPLSASEQRVREDLTRLKRAERIQVLLDSLYQAYEPRFQDAQIALLSRRSGQAGEALPEFGEAEAQLPLCVFAGGQIAIADLLLTAREAHFSARQLADPGAVLQLLKNVSVPACLFEAEARRLKLDQDPQLLGALEQKRRELSVEVLRQREVDRRVAVSEEEARAFYEAYPEKFTAPETILATEILVASDSLAQRLKQAMQEGADPARLALEHTRRQGAVHHQGQVRLNVFTEVFFQGIFDAARRLEVGEVGGPVRVREGYSVFKVTDKVREKAPYDAESRRRAIAYVKVDKAKRGYVDYVRGLRGKYGVQVYEDALAAMDRQKPQ